MDKTWHINRIVLEREFDNADEIQDYKLSNTMEYVILYYNDGIRGYIINYETRLVLSTRNGGFTGFFRIADREEYVARCLLNLTGEYGGSGDLTIGELIV